MSQEPRQNPFPLPPEAPQQTPFPVGPERVAPPAFASPSPSVAPVPVHEAPSGFRRWVGRNLGLQTEQQKVGRAEYAQLLDSIATGTADPNTMPRLLAAARAKADLREREDYEMRAQAMQRAADRVLADDYLSEEEETDLNTAFHLLGLGQEDLNNQLSGMTVRVMIARVNSGRLVADSEAQLMAQPGEEVYLEVPARMLKEVTLREYRGGYSGVSFRVTKGVRFHTGGTRGRMVPVGTQIQVADTGFLAVTNKRAVYVGQRKTQEYRYTKLVGMQLYSDGMTLQVSNRQNSTTLGLDQPDLVAAFINAAAQESL